MTFLVGLAFRASALALELSLLTAAWMICFSVYSSASAFSASVLSLSPPEQADSLHVLPGHRCVWYSTSARKSMKLLLPCSSLSRLMMALSLLTNLRRVCLVFSTTCS